MQQGWYGKIEKKNEKRKSEYKDAESEPLEGGDLTKRKKHILAKKVGWVKNPFGVTPYR